MAIDYELAKKLKDAGFRIQPSVNRSGYTLTESGEVKDDFHNYHKEKWQYKGEHYFIPTLSELIEACEKKGTYLTLTNSKVKKLIDNAIGLIPTKKWLAIADFSSGKGYNHYTGTGDTTETAFAKLWLILNKK